MRSKPDTTLEEKAVLGVLVTDKPRGLGELQQAVERRYGGTLQLDAGQLQAILTRLESLGLIARVEP